MRKVEAQHSHAQNQPAVRQGKDASLESPQGEQIAQLEAMAEGSSQAGKLMQLVATMAGGPRMAAQRKAADAIHSSPHITAQRQRLEAGAAVQREEVPAKPNNTGLPDNLKSGIESLSGMSMDSVRVHYNSSQPAQLNALAYAQGTDIHVAPGQEQHLPHEAWHVVQQAQGRVQPTMQMKDGVPVNDDQGLEHEADVMGAEALNHGFSHFVFPAQSLGQSSLQRQTVQRQVIQCNGTGDVLGGLGVGAERYMWFDQEAREEEGRARDLPDWIQKRQELQARHVHHQQSLYQVIDQPYDIMNFAMSPSIGIPVEILLENTKEYIKRRLVVIAMTPTLTASLKPPREFERFWPEVPEEAPAGKLFFDDNVAYPDTGSDNRAAEGLRKSDAGIIERTSGETAHQDGMSIRVFMDRQLNVANLNRVLIHEIQHAADKHDNDFQEGIIADVNREYGDVANRYRTEFRAYWVGDRHGGFGGPNAPAQNNRRLTQWWYFYRTHNQSTNFQNVRQENIFWHMVDCGSYPWIKPNYLQSEAFRTVVDGMAIPSGGNLVNSLRIDNLRSDLKSDSPNFNYDVDGIINDAQSLDAYDRMILQSPYGVQFWNFFDAQFATPATDPERVALLKEHLEQIIGRP